MTRRDGGAPADRGGLTEMRRRIEDLDEALVRLVAERMRLARDIGAAKRTSGRPTLDPAREAAVVRRAGALAREAGLPEDDVRALFWQIIALARRLQMQEGA